MSQNDADQDDKSRADDDSSKVTEDDLRKLKYGDDGVDGDSGKDDQDDPSGSDDDADDDKEAGKDDDSKTADDDQDDDSDDDSKDDADDDDSEFVKEFPNIKGDTLVEYARSMEHTLSESNKEGKRLATENQQLTARVAELESGQKTDKGTTTDDKKGSDDQLTPEQGYIRQKMNEEIDKAFETFSKDYPQVDDTAEYNKFVNEVKILAQTIKTSQNRFASPGELYTKAAAILGWKPSEVTDKDRMKVAVKDRAAVSKTTSSTKKAPKSKVTEAMIRTNRRMYPNKTDEEIRKELEPYVQ